MGKLPENLRLPLAFPERWMYNTHNSHANREGRNRMEMEKCLARILPVPKSITGGNAEGKYPPHIRVQDERFLGYLPVCRENFRKFFDLSLTDGEGGVYLCRDDALDGEAYRISCTPEGIFLCSAGTEGMGSALSTLYQILRNAEGSLAAPLCTIQDAPDCAYRTVMVDLPAWRTMEEMFRYVDLCHLYKIRYLHLHLADNGGYCLPSRLFPDLPTPGKHFTFAQVSMLRQYCRERNVEIIPEIDVPGHTGYLSKACADWLCTGSEDPAEEIRPDGTVRRDLLCVGKPGVMEKLRALFAEVMELFPESRYFHIGGDEAATESWNTCRYCRTYMQEHGIAGDRALYTHFIKVASDMVLEMGRTPVVWEGFPKEGAEEISRDVVVTAWESLYHLPQDLLAEGFTITNASWMPLYMVHPDSYHARFVKDGRWQPEEILTDWTVYTWKNWWEKSFAYEKPIVVEPTPQVIGATFCVWLTDFAVELPVIRENLPAMCERLWNTDSTLSAEEFRKRFAHLASLADKL